MDGYTVASSARILIVDDEPKICSFIGRALATANYQSDSAGDGAEALSAITRNRYDLIILDLLMPGPDGRQVLHDLLDLRPGQPVMVLSCVANVTAKVELLNLGAQDYLTKPFSLAELIARVRARLRSDPAPGASEIIPSRGGITLDAAHLIADAGNGPVSLSRLEFMLLSELAMHAGQPVSKGRLLASVWGYHSDPGSNILDACVRRLRSKLGFELIKTVRGEGYQLISR
jgi:DNA-binding response OmpR family regulator